MGEDLTRNCRIVFDNGVERTTSIRFFIEKALNDPEAEVYDAETGKQVTELSQAVEAAS